MTKSRPPQADEAATRGLTPTPTAPDDLGERLRVASVPKWWQLRPSRIARTQDDANLFAEAAAALLADRAERDALREMMGRLTNEFGALMPFEDGIRAVIGNTNWVVLRDAAIRARALLTDKPAP